MYIHIFSKIISNVSFDRSTFSGLCCAPNQTQLTVFRERSSAGQAAAASKVEIYNANTLAAVWVSQDKPQPGPALHTWSPLASLFGPHCSLMTVAILIRDTWSRGEVAASLHRVYDLISVMSRTLPTTVCMRCCHARRPSCQSGHHCCAGAGSLPGWVLQCYIISTVIIINIANCDHVVYTPTAELHYMGSSVFCCEEVWSSSRRSCDVWQQRDKCRQFLRRKMWRFRSYQ